MKVPRMMETSVERYSTGQAFGLVSHLLERISLPSRASVKVPAS